jgi:hypothetical protein
MLESAERRTCEVTERECACEGHSLAGERKAMYKWGHGRRASERGGTHSLESAGPRKSEDTEIKRAG